MREVKLGLISKCNVVLYDSIKELPAERHHEIKKLVLQDSGIGSDMESITNHLSKIYLFLSNDRKDEAMQETQNLHNNLYYQIEKIDLTSYCFAAMIKSVNGKEVTIDELESEGYVKNLLGMLSKKGLKMTDVSDIVEDVKKNFKKNFDPTFLISLEEKATI
jgi:hypothetical protein